MAETTSEVVRVCPRGWQAASDRGVAGTRGKLCGLMHNDRSGKADSSEGRVGYVYGELIAPAALGRILCSDLVRDDGLRAMLI